MHPHAIKFKLKGKLVAWLSILAKKNEGASEFVSVEDIAVAHWKEYGRKF